jgi:hypothetical protein
MAVRTYHSPESISILAARNKGNIHLLPMHCAPPQVVKWLSKEERVPRRKNLRRHEYSGTGARKMLQNGEFGVLENMGAWALLVSRYPLRGWCTGAVQSSPKGTLRVDDVEPEQQK